jgi:hypothetical protein
LIPARFAGGPLKYANAAESMTNHVVAMPSAVRPQSQPERNAFGGIAEYHGTGNFMNQYVRNPPKDNPAARLQNGKEK